jgi:GalNAc-alpha-(1->4)-GalNAc-alpha-(1->3)-diNAcBac-PP-undecaprenol alpha-1,4-N-acetyl-D-galactosaminyltransferase
VRIALVISSMGPGGAERVMSHLASFWAREGHEVWLHTFSSPEKPSFYELDPAVHLVALDLPPLGAGKFLALLDLMRRAWCLRQQWIRLGPEVVVSFMDLTNIVTLISTRFTSIRTVVSERSNPAMQPLTPIWRGLRDVLYGCAHRIVVLTRPARDFFPERLRERITIVPNPILVQELERGDPGGIPHRTIVAMGRLGREKGFDVFLRALARVLPARPDWRVTVLGAGPLRHELESSRNALGLANRVNFAGLCPEPYPVLAAADVFVLSSRYEGFPNALLEAMGTGLPAVTTDFPGHDELVTAEYDALVVPREDEEALADALARLMDDPDLRRLLGRHAMTVRDRFSLQTVMAAWDQVLDVRPVPAESTGVR